MGVPCGFQRGAEPGGVFGVVKEGSKFGFSGTGYKSFRMVLVTWTWLLVGGGLAVGTMLVVPLVAPGNSERNINRSNFTIGLRPGRRRLMHMSTISLR
jgi:hypothetical protein